jgi:crossover junction endodeoxyribonuclease RusA
VIEFVIGAKPVPQGSMVVVTPPAALRKGAPAVVAPVNASKMRSWRQRVTRAARATGEPMWVDTPLRLTVTFWLRKPKSAKRTAPSVRPDLDKLVRAIGDAITGVLYKDDAQLTTLVAMKRYTQGGDCVVIRLEEDAI